MQFLDGQTPSYDLTYSDVFLVPSFTKSKSRYDVDVKPADSSGLTFPVVVSNMTAIAGQRMAETVARRGGLVILPQDKSDKEIREITEYVKSKDKFLETPITLNPDSTIQKALNLVHKRAHEAVIVVDKKNEPVGIFTVADSKRQDRFVTLEFVMSKELVTLNSSMNAEKMFDKLDDERLSFAPVVKGKKLIGAMTRKGAVRSTIYKPAVDKNKKLLVAAAVGINGAPARRAKKFVNFGVDVIVVDTAHGHQDRMLDAVRTVRKAVGPDITIVGGNVVTAQGTEDLIEAGADIVKVGVGPGAMCTTRMMTAVGRPQFSAILECAPVARARGKHVWADGGIRYPRDVALAIAAGASSSMFGSWWAGTYESASDTFTDADGRLYKENFGMASARAVNNRSRNVGAFDRARKAYFQEGISTSKVYLQPGSAGAEDIIDQIGAGLRSAMTYSGATSLEEFHQKAVVGIQSGTGYYEGKPVSTNW